MLTGNAVTSTPIRDVRRSLSSIFFVACLCVATLLVAGLAAFHIHGFFVMSDLISLGREVIIPIYNISTADHFNISIPMLQERVQEFRWLSFALVLVVVGLGFRLRFAWLASIIMCGVLIRMHLSMMVGKTDKWNAVHWSFNYYCLLTLLMLLLAAPIFFNRRRKPSHPE
jgi:hypothetical protein